MLSIPLRISTDTNITVTATATGLYTLMDTASTLQNAQTYYDDAHANAVMIQPYDGDVRFLIGTDPTTDEGTIIPAGHTWYLPGVELNEIRLIRAVAWDVVVSVVPYLSEKGESPSQVNLPWFAFDSGSEDPIKLLSTGRALHTAVQNLPTEYPLPASQVSTLTPPAAITGFATSAKQLPDNHNVTVSNMIAEVEKGLATSDNQTNNAQTANIVGVDYVAGKRGIDAMTETLQFIDYNHHQIHAGNHFLISDVVDLAGSNVYDMQFTTPNTTKWSHFIFKLDCESETEWYIYEGVTINTAGTAITPVNNNRNSLTASVNTIAGIINASVADANADTAVAGATVLEHGIIGDKQSGGNEAREFELILKQNTKYCFRAIANTAGYTDFIASWYEHTSLN